MNETTVTVVGTVCSEVRYTQSPENNPIARFQIRNTPRRYDKRTGTWTDGDPNYFSAVCWRTLADHVASSMGVGDPVVATGRLRITRWRRGEENMINAELDIQAIGHDLRWGTSVYRKSTPPTPSRIPGPGQRRREEAAAAAAAAAASAESDAAAGSAGPSPGAAETTELAPAGVGASAGAAAAPAPNTEAAAAETVTTETTAETTAAQREVRDLPTAA